MAFALVCFLALSQSGRHERTATVLCTLLCAGPIAGCSAMLAVRRYGCYRSLVVPSWCAQKKQVQKQNKTKKESRDRYGKKKIPRRLLRDERWEKIARMSSEVGEIVAS